MTTWLRRPTAPRQDPHRRLVGGDGEVRGLLASCGCGWHGGHHAPTEARYEAAVDERERVHARPLVAKTVPAALTALIGDVKRDLSQLVAERPLAAAEALRGLASWAEATAARAQDAARIGATQAALNRVGRRPASGRRLGL